MSTGGGASHLHYISGDFPAAALRGVKTQSNLLHDSNGFERKRGSPEWDRVAILTYNVCSLQAEGRLDRLLHELDGKEWDVVVLTETKRELSREEVGTLGNHTFLGAGGCKGRRGVGFLVNERLKHKKRVFTCLSDRVATLELSFLSKKLCICGVYMPDSSYPDAEVEHVYNMLDELLAKVKRRRLGCVITGDLNAQVGPREAHDNPEIIGLHGIQCRNERGRWLTQWCGLHDLAVGNTFFDAEFERQWTYRKGDLKEQLDYILVNRAFRTSLKSCCTLPDVDIGSDHRCIASILEGRSSPKKQVKNGRRGVRSWPVQIPQYQKALDIEVGKLTVSANADERAGALEQCMLMAAASAPAEDLDDIEPRADVLLHQIRGLIDERRQMMQDTDITAAMKQTRRKELNKAIQKLTRRRIREQKQSKISSILQEFRGLKRIPDIKGGVKKKEIECMIGSGGQEVRSKQGIADVFASFYEQMYACRGQQTAHAAGQAPVTLEAPCTSDELQAALLSMKNGKAKDTSGIIAEMLKVASKSLLDAVLTLFNDVFHFAADVPEVWRRTKLVVIFKKGDPKSPANYRPIAILPILYKLFSAMLCKRVTPFIIQHQSVDQAAYRTGFSTEDHLLTVSLLIEKSKEFNFPMWFALIDFEKAFDSVDHQALWDVLAKQAVPDHYIKMLQRLYDRQVAFVRAGKDSREFGIYRGVKQGDPISAILFIAIMQDLLGGLELSWERANARRKGRHLGLPVGGLRHLTNLRFADDVIPTAQSREDIQKMLRQFAVAAVKYGLKIHQGKTKILTWDVLALGAAPIVVDGIAIKVLGETEAERYLGRKLCFQDSCQVELQNRLDAGWAAFHKHKAELCSKFYRTCDRVRLFDAVVTPVILYGAGAWALTQDMERRLQTTWRRMLRYVFCLHRKGSISELEDWVSYMQRTADAVDSLAVRYNLSTWVAAYRKHKSVFAGRVARHTDHRWSSVVLEWRPDSCRSQGRPCTRWSDDLDKFAGGSWPELARGSDDWDFLSELFAVRPS